MTSLLDLAERVERASGPDRELDEAIWLAAKCHVEPEHPYTVSTDSAMTLIPEGWWLSALYWQHPYFRSEGDHEWIAEIAGPVTWVEYDHLPEPKFDSEGGKGATPALALCAAALRARAERGEG